jgi:hypothetical protein
VVQEAAEEAEEDGPDVTVVRGRQDVEWLDEDNGRKLRAYLVGAEIKTLKKRGKSRPEGSFNLEDSLLELEQVSASPPAVLRRPHTRARRAVQF